MTFSLGFQEKWNSALLLHALLPSKDCIKNNCNSIKNRLYSILLDACWNEIFFSLAFFVISVLRWFWTKLKKPSTKPTQDYKVFLRDSKSVFLKSLAVRAWNPLARQQCQISPIQAIWLHYLAGWFHALTARILRKINLESLKKTL